MYFELTFKSLGQNTFWHIFQISKPSKLLALKAKEVCHIFYFKFYNETKQQLNWVHKWKQKKNLELKCFWTSVEYISALYKSTSANAE